MKCGMWVTVNAFAKFLPGVDSRQSLPRWNGASKPRPSPGFCIPLNFRSGKLCVCRVRLGLPTPLRGLRARRGGAVVLRSPSSAALGVNPVEAAGQGPPGRLSGCCEIL